MFFFFIDPDEVPIFGPELARLEAALDQLRAVDPGMSIGTATALIKIGRRLPALALGSETLKGIGMEMGIPYSSFLRHTDLLAEGAEGTKSLGLIEKGVHPQDRRARQVRLTADGEALLRRLDALYAKDPG
jgi:DNA-binding MarR family transcriptional regulator